jgi:hypothetical protein
MPLLAASEPVRGAVTGDTGNRMRRALLNCKGKTRIRNSKPWHALTLQTHLNRRKGAPLGVVHADSRINPCLAVAVYTTSGARSFPNHLTPWLWSWIHRWSSGVSLDG